MLNRPLLGAHVSIAGGVDKAPRRGRDLTCDCIQIFSKNQSQWRAKPLMEDNIRGFKEGLAENNIGGVLIHSSYLINLASPDEKKHKMSMDAFLDEIDRADQLEVKQFVFHPGSHLGEGEEKGLMKIAESLNVIISSRPGSRVKILLENTAGQGTNLGYRFEHLAMIIELVEDKERMGVCFDTAHGFASGLELRTLEGYEEVWKSFDSIVGLERLKAFHLNDSKKDLNTRVDRHEHIGQGLIGLEAFRMLLNDPRFAGMCMYLETPQGEAEYLENLRVLRALFKNQANKN